MKLYFNDTEIPVIWEDNQTVQELMEEAGKGDIVVQMSMYSDNEQVGSLGKSYTKNDEQITTHSGDIVLYSALISSTPPTLLHAWERLSTMTTPSGPTCFTAASTHSL